MARSQETYNKKEVQIRKDKKRKEKEQKRMEKRLNPKAGGNFDDMIAYVDENGRLTSERPEVGVKKTTVKAEDIVISTPKQTDARPESKTRTGIINFFNESKGYGFIRDLENNQNVFVHINDMEERMKENDRVNFEVEKGARGAKAVKVRINRIG
jgi:cold shock CspA family protein